MQLTANTLHPEQHDAEETRLEKKGGQHFIGHERTDHRSRLVGKHCPVGAELIRHDDARHDAHAEGDCKNLEPVFEQRQVNLAARAKPKSL